MPMIDDAAVAVLRASTVFPRGSIRLARIFTALRPSLRRYPARTKYGTIVCDLSEVGCFVPAVYGEIPRWRSDEAAIDAIPLTKHSVVLDIGANIGIMTCIFAKRVKHVHAFEPAPRSLPLLYLNAPKNCTVHPVAIGDREGTVNFAETEGLDMSHVAEEGIEVPVRTVDSFELKPDFIKIDVEGYEPQVLRGAMETLKAGPIVMFEALTREAFDECKAILLAANPDYTFTDMGSGENFLARV